MNILSTTMSFGIIVFYWLIPVAFTIYAVLLLLFNKIHLTSWFLFDHKKRNRPRLISGLIPYVGVALTFSKNPYAYVQSLRQRYGEDIFTIYVMGQFMTFVCHPIDVASVFSSAKQYEMEELGNIFAHKLFGISREALSSTELHNASNRLISKHLQRDGLELLTKRAQERLEHCLKNDPAPVDEHGWRERPLLKLAEWLIADASTFAIFGDGVSSDQLLPLFSTFNTHIPLLHSDLPEFMKRKAFEDRSKYTSLFKREAFEGACPLVQERSVLIECLNEDDRAAAHASLNWLSLVNTSIATFWSLYHLMELPQRYTEEIVEEAKSILKEVDHLRSTDSLLPPLNHQLLAKMTKLDSLIDETLRVSSLSFVARRAKGDVRFIDHRGSTYKFHHEEFIMLVPSNTDEEVFEDPTAFKPYRFMAKAEQKWTKGEKRIPLSGAFVVFGGGTHHCPGRFFAKNEIKLLACVLLQVLEFEIVDAERAVPDESKAGIVFMPPKKDVRVRYRFRANTDQ